MSKMDTVKIDDMRNVKDSERAMQIARWLLTPLGLWPVESSGLKTLRLFSIVICSLLLAFLLVPSVLYLILIEKDFKIRLKLVGPLSFTTMNICKYLGILRKNQEIRKCIRLMAIDWHEIETTSEREIMLTNTRMARTFTIVCAIFMYGGGLPYTTVLPIARGVLVIGNMTFRQYSYPSYFIFFDPHTKQNFQIIYSIHCMCGVVTYTVTIALCSLAIVFILHICGQLAITSWMLENLAGNFDNKSLGKIVRKHINALSFAKRLENIMMEMCFVELTGCSFNICMLGFYFITELGNSELIALVVFSLLFTSFTFNIFIFCYLGNLLTERCSNLGKVVYTINWYQLPAKEARNFLLIVSATYRPVILTAGKLVSLSLFTFASVLKISFSYLNMLYTLTSNAN